MNNIIKLTDTQQQVLSHAADHPEGRVTWFPESVKGGARSKVLQSLASKALITGGEPDWTLADAGYDALGRPRPAPANVEPEPAVEAAVVAPEAAEAASDQERQVAAQRLLKVGVEGKPRTREHSKQAIVIELLKRPEGATIPQVMAATGWQAHTVRGTFAGAFKKKLGLNVVSDKPEGGQRTYRITDEAVSPC